MRVHDPTTYDLLIEERRAKCRQYKRAERQRRKVANQLTPMTTQDEIDNESNDGNDMPLPTTEYDLPRTNVVSPDPQVSQTYVVDDYIHKQTWNICKEKLKLDRDGDLVLDKKKKIRKTPIIVYPYDLPLDDPFKVVDEEKRTMLMTLPTKESKEMFSGPDMDKFKESMLKEIGEQIQRGGTTVRRTTMKHFGLRGNEDACRWFVLAIVTAAECVRSKFKTWWTVACLSMYNNSDMNMEMLVELKKIGSKVHQAYVKQGKDEALKRIELQRTWWAKAIETLNLYAPHAGPEYKLDSGLFGCYTTTVSVGVGSEDHATGDHRDRPNASFEFNGIHDSHLNVTPNQNMGMVVHLLDADGYLQPYIIVLDELTLTFWSARTFYHSIVHVGTYLKYLYQKTTNNTNENEMLGVKEFRTDGAVVALREECYYPMDEKTNRLFITFYTKRNLPILSDIYDAYKGLNEEMQIMYHPGTGASVHDYFEENRLVLVNWPEELCNVRSITDVMNIQGSGHFGPSCM
jgi:hypothetical protein